MSPLSAKVAFERLYAEAARKGKDRGSGNRDEQTSALASQLPSVLQELGVRSLLDISCRGASWIRRAHLPLDRYVGVDFVEGAVDAARDEFAGDGWTFETLDFLSEPLPEADAILCRNVLPRLSFADSFRMVANVRRSGAEYFLATTFVDRGENRDVPNGKWRPLNLCRRPFDFPTPLRSIDERCTEGNGRYRDKCLGIWRTSDLPVWDGAVPGEAGMLLPKTFHQIWLGGPMPEEYLRYGLTWDRLHPGWRRRLWRESDIEKLSNFRNRRAFDLAPTYSGKANILRYEILSEFGGVYVDTDFECLKNCEELFAGAQAFVSENAINRPDYACNGLMGAVPQHPYVEDLIRVIGETFDPKPHSVYSTGPRLISQMLERHPEVRVLQKERLYRTDWCGRPLGRLPELYADHHWKRLKK